MKMQDHDVTLELGIVASSRLELIAARKEKKVEELAIDFLTQKVKTTSVNKSAGKAAAGKIVR